MSATYTGAKTVTVTTTVTKFVEPKVRKVLIIENTGAVDLRFGFWANLTASPVAGPVGPTDANTTTGSGAGILVKAGTSYTLDSTGSPLLIAQEELYLVVATGTTTANIISLF